MRAIVTFYIVTIFNITLLSHHVTIFQVGVHERTRFGATYSINKPDFLEIYQEA